MTIAEKWQREGWLKGRKEGRKQGWQQGWQEGWLEGRLESSQETIEFAISVKFGIETSARHRGIYGRSESMRQNIK